MKKSIPVLFFLFIFSFAKAQNIQLRGNINDTATKQTLPNALLMAIKFKDSTLVNFTRTNKEGLFKPIKIPQDTYIVIISHPNFSDKTYLVVPSKTDTVFNFKNVILPPKSVVLNEVEVFAYKEKTYYKGDTLIFTADSFKTQPNATVEDLLKKLPGVRVDAAGKITIQGKEVDQVLVDGDEFFGSDPTIATRNLNATTVENVQVYDKKSEDPESSTETVKVVNLKLKEDAKKGYFGKVSSASDFGKFDKKNPLFYENELLANKFKGNQKISVFGIFANTPKQAFGWEDQYKYGLDNEQNNSYNEETGMWMSDRDDKTGVPQTLKTGFYLNDKFGKKTKLNSSYTFNQNQLVSGTETNTQFFLEDTNYTNKQVIVNSQKNQNHAFDMRLTVKLDSLTELTFKPKINYNISEGRNFQNDEFISAANQITRQTNIINTSERQNIDATASIKINRNFLKKDRNFVITYQPNYVSSNANSLLSTDFIYTDGQLANSSINQKRKQENSKLEHIVNATYTEPWTKKIKSEFTYNFIDHKSANYRNTYDFSGTGYDLFNPALSNNFENKRQTNKVGTKLVYEIKKYRVGLQMNYRNVYQQNVNITTGQKLQQSVNNFLPAASFNYRPNQGSNLNILYISSSQQPDLNQMQPVIDNTDPNRIVIGNPNLKPTFTNNLSVNYYFYKGISDRNLYAGGNFGNTNDQISYSSTFDSLGKTISQPINIDGNYYASVYMGNGFPLFKRFMKLYYNLNMSYNNNVSLVNGSKTISQSTNLSPGMNVEKNSDKFTVNIGANYNYNLPRSNISIQSNQPYYSYEIYGTIFMKFPKGFSITSDGKYNNNGNRVTGYNLNYFILNASLAKSFFKTEDLIISINANDILNQNIANDRYISSNQIVDTKTQIIKRYFLLKVLYKFNSQKTKVEDEFD